MLHTVIAKKNFLEPTTKQDPLSSDDIGDINELPSNIADLMNADFDQTTINRVKSELTKFISPNGGIDNDRAQLLVQAKHYLSCYFNTLVCASDDLKSILLTHLVKKLDEFFVACYEGRLNLAQQLYAHARALCQKQDTQTFLWDYMRLELENALIQKRKHYLPPTHEYANENDQHLAKNIQEFLYRYGMSSPSDQTHFGNVLHYHYFIFNWFAVHFNANKQLHILFKALKTKYLSAFKLPNLGNSTIIEKQQALTAQLDQLSSDIQYLAGLKYQSAKRMIQWIMPPLNQHVWLYHTELPSRVIEINKDSLKPYFGQYYTIEKDDLDPQANLDYFPSNALIYSAQQNDRSKKLYLVDYNPEQCAFTVSSNECAFGYTEKTMTIDYNKLSDVPTAVIAFDPNAPVNDASAFRNLSRLEQFKGFLADDNEQYGAKYQATYQQQRFIDAWGFLNGQAYNGSFEFLKAFNIELLEAVANQMIILKLMNDHEINKRFNKTAHPIPLSIDSALCESLTVFANKHSLLTFLTALSEKIHRKNPDYLFTFAFYIMSASSHNLKKRLEKADRIYDNFNTHKLEGVIPEGDHPHAVTTLECISHYTYLTRITKSNFGIYELLIDFLALIPSRVNQSLQEKIYHCSILLVSQAYNYNPAAINYIYAYIPGLLPLWFNGFQPLPAKFNNSINNFLAHKPFKDWLLTYLSKNRDKRLTKTIFEADYTHWMNQFYNTTLETYSNHLLSPILDKHLGPEQLLWLSSSEFDEINNDVDMLHLKLAIPSLQTLDCDINKLASSLLAEMADWIRKIDFSLSFINLLLKAHLYEKTSTQYPINLIERLMRGYHNIKVTPSNFNRFLYGASLVIGLGLIYYQMLIIGLILAIGGLFMLLYPSISAQLKQIQGYTSIYLKADENHKSRNIWLQNSDVSFFKAHELEKNFQFIDGCIPSPI